VEVNVIGKIVTKRSDAGSPLNLMAYLIFGKGKDREQREPRASSSLFINTPSQNYADFAQDASVRRDAADGKDNIYHFVIALTDQEKDRAATDQQLQQVARIALNELGLSEYASALIVHRDTSFPHIHVAVDLVHPDTYTRKPRPSHDFARLAKACRIAEARFGWVKGKGHFAGDRAAAKEIGEPEPPKPDHSSRKSKVRDADAQHGESSFQSRIEGSKDLQSIFRDSSSWHDLQSRLAEYGQEQFGSDLIYKVFGSGAVLTLADHPDFRGKASLVHHSASLNKLEKRFGPLPQAPNPAANSAKPAVASPRASSAKPATPPNQKSKDPFYDLYWEAKKLHQARKDDNKAGKDALRARQKSEMDTLKKLQYAERRQLFREITDNQSRRAADSLRALKSAQQREILETAHVSERKSLYQASRFPSWREWLSTQAETDPKAAERLKRLKEPTKPISTPKTSAVLADVTTSQNADGSIHYQKNNETISVDLGEMMKLMKTDEDSILTNLKIAQAKFGSRFDIKAKNIDKYIKIAALNGIFISTLSTEQQEQWKAIREEEFSKYRTKPKPEKPETKDSSSNHHRRNRHNAQETHRESNDRSKLHAVHLRQEQDNQYGRSKGRDEGR
jgi:hypothetical protein